MTKSDRSELLPIDWERVEADYRAGVLSVREMGKRHGCSHTAIQLKAKQSHWTRDLRAKIKQRTDELLAMEHLPPALATASPASERAIVEGNAEVVAGVMLGHRRDIRRMRSLLADQMAEAERLTRSPEVFAQARDALANPDEHLPAIVERMAEFVTSLPQRVRLTKDISETLRTVIAMEREALSMDDKQAAPADPSSFENLVDLATRSIAAREQAEAPGDRLLGDAKLDLLPSVRPSAASQANRRLLEHGDDRQRHC